MEQLPIEILTHIALSLGQDTSVYRAMLAVPAFARKLTPGIIVDYMIRFGFSVEITKDMIAWKKLGLLHRVGGPAKESTEKHGECYQPKTDFRLCFVRRWFQNGIQHRDGGPASECDNGELEWYCQGERHRLNGPAHIWDDGTAIWYKNGRICRDDGPAEIFATGDPLYIPQYIMPSCVVCYDV